MSDSSRSSNENEYPSNTSYEKHTRVIGPKRHTLRNLESRIRNTVGARAEEARRGVSTKESSAERKMKEEYKLLENSIKRANHNYESGKPGRNQRDAIKRLQRKVIDAKREYREALSEEKEAQDEKDSTQQAYDKAIKEDKDAEKAQKEEDKAAKKAKRVPTVFYTQQIKTARTDAARANIEAQVALKDAKAVAKRAASKVSSLEAELEAARPSSGSHTGGTRKLRRKNN